MRSSHALNPVRISIWLTWAPFSLPGRWVCWSPKVSTLPATFKGPSGSSEIRTLVSDWQIEHGVAQAQDVALTTGKHRVAIQGGLDLVNEKFNDLTMALVDTKGCAKVRQTIRGSFLKPQVEKPSILKSLFGPVEKALQVGRDFSLVESANRSTPAWWYRRNNGRHGTE